MRRQNTGTGGKKCPPLLGSPLPVGSCKWDGAGKAALGTGRVNTSAAAAGDCTDGGVSSAGGVKSISSSKLSSNSYKSDKVNGTKRTCLKLRAESNSEGVKRALESWLYQYLRRSHNAAAMFFVLKC